MTMLAVALAGALGAVSRYVVDVIVTARTGGSMPWGTLVVNVTGSLVGGLVAGLAVVGSLRAEVGLVAGLGFAGSFTTFATFTVETVGLAADGSRARALAYVAATVAASVGAAGTGFAAVAAFA